MLNFKVDIYFSKRTKPSAKYVTAQIKGVSTTKMKYKNGLGYVTIVSNLRINWASSNLKVLLLNGDNAGPFQKLSV